MRLSRLIAFSTILALGLLGPLPAQELGEEIEEGAIISVDVQVVNVLATVRDKDGVLLSDLSASDFELYEDGVKQDITYFSRQSDLPLTIGLLVDTSVSQQNLVAEERAASYRFFDKVLRVDKDLAFLMSFDIDVELLQDLTAAKVLLQDGLERLEVQGSTRSVTPGPVPQGGRPVGTAMFDSVFLASEEVLKNQSGRKAIVLISDGYDAGSKIDLDGAIEASLRADTILFAIRYYDRYFYVGQSVIGGGDGDLKHMARATGGEVYEVRRKTTLDWIFDDINAIVRNQYSLGYTPKRNLSEKGFRKIEIKMKNKRYKAQTREGYYPSEI